MADGEIPYTEEEVACIKYDALGNVLLDAEYMIADGEIMLGAYMVGEETVSPEHGYPLEYILREFYPLESDFGGADYYLSSRAGDDDILAPVQTLEGEWENYIKIDFSEYKIPETVGVDAIAADVADGKAEYFTIDGRRVNGVPSAGLYIRRTAAGASKVLVK